MLETIWFLLWGVLWAVYFVLDGYDLGMRPNSSSRQEMTRKYPATIHCTCGRLAPKPWPMLGRAVFTMFASRVDMEDPKFWVKRCLELENGAFRILKLEFQESFDQHIGPLTIPCRRSAAKEARILRLVAGDARFMTKIARGEYIIRDIDKLYSFVNACSE